MQCDITKLTLILCFTASLNAHADLITSASGLSVYDNSWNFSWTTDANLLGTLEDQQGYDTVINNIITASPTIQDIPNSFDNGGSGIYQLSARNFSAGGLVDWWGRKRLCNI